MNDKVVTEMLKLQNEDREKLATLIEQGNLVGAMIFCQCLEVQAYEACGAEDELEPVHARICVGE